MLICDKSGNLFNLSNIITHFLQIKTKPVSFSRTKIPQLKLTIFYVSSSTVGKLRKKHLVRQSLECLRSSVGSEPGLLMIVCRPNPLGLLQIYQDTFKSFVLRPPKYYYLFIYFLFVPGITGYHRVSPGITGYHTTRWQVPLASERRGRGGQPAVATPPGPRQ
jgi:hypothetical protein